MKSLSLRSPQRRALAFAAATLFVENIFYVGVLPLLPLYAEKYDLSAIGVGIIVGSYAAGVIAGSVPAALLGARIGFRRLAAIGLCVLAVATAGFGLGQDIVLLDVCRFAQGIGAGFAWVGALGWTAVVAPPARRGLVIGIVMSTAVTGAVLGPVVGALAVHLSVESVFGVLAALQAAIGIGVFAQHEDHQLAGVGHGGPRPPARIQLVAMSFVALPATLAGLYETLTPLRLDAAGAGTPVIAAVFVTGAAAEVIGGPLAGRLSDSTGRLLPLCLALAVAPVGCVALTAATGQAALFILAVLAWLAITSAWTPGIALVADLSGGIGARAAHDWALLNVVLAGGVLLGSTVGPVTAAWLGEAATYALAGVGCLAAIAGGLRHRNELSNLAR